MKPQSTSLKRLAILDDYQGVASRLGPWSALPPDLEVTALREHLGSRDAVVARLQPFDAVVAMRERTPFPRAVLERLPNLRLLVTTGARNQAIDVRACSELGIVVSGTPAFGTPTAELAWGLILSLVRDIPRQQASLREGRWQRGLGSALEGKTLGVIGLGKLGGRVARIGLAFGMRVVAFSQNLTEERAAEVGAARVDKGTLLREADVVTLHLVLSERSRHTLAAADLALMKPSAFLVNTSRAALVEQEALVAALRAGRLAGAALDVFDEEPLGLEHPLLHAPNTLLTPHLGYVTEENFRAYFEGAVESVLAYLAGSPIRVLGP